MEEIQQNMLWYYLCPMLHFEALPLELTKYTVYYIKQTLALAHGFIKCRSLGLGRGILKPKNWFLLHSNNDFQIQPTALRTSRTVVHRSSADLLALLG